jgi:hypothetical protein
MDKNYIENVPLLDPRLGIAGGGGSPDAHNVRHFYFKQNSELSGRISGWVGALWQLGGAKGFGGVASSDLADGYTRVYTLLASLDSTGTPVYSAVFGNDLLTGDIINWAKDINLGNAVTDPTTNITDDDSKKAVIGYIIIDNGQGGGTPFVPGTTDLDAGGVNAEFINNFGFVGR